MHRFMASTFAVIAPLLLAVVSGGCASEVVPSSGKRVATSADQVAIYQKAPRKYEILGTVTANKAEGASWDNRGDANQAFDTLKTKAAALGANGLLLVADKGENTARATAGYHGEYYEVPIRGVRPNTTALGKAIYVIDK